MKMVVELLRGETTCFRSVEELTVKEAVKLAKELSKETGAEVRFSTILGEPVVCASNGCDARTE